MNLSDSLNELRLELLNQYITSENITQCRSEKRDILINKIELVTAEVIKTIARKELPYFTAARTYRSNNRFSKKLPIKSSMQIKLNQISFGSPKSRCRFSVIMFLLSKIHKLLGCFKSSTRRELYYENLDVFKSQTQVDHALKDICSILGVPTWELGVTSTAKGMVAGPLTFKSKDGFILNCDKPGGVLIPQNVFEVELISSTVQWVLIVEKDAAFQKILDSDGLGKFRECVFITGKGFPDLNTRLLVCRLWDCFKIPIFALVDADAYGLEIMCTYRFGSLTYSQFSDRLTCPSLRWLGIHPSDIKLLATDFMQLTSNDIRKITSLAERNYIQNNEKLKAEVQILLNGKIKAEIEGISNISANYITDTYIPSKINCKEYY